MILLLIVFLIVIDIGLRIFIINLDLAFFIGARFENLASGAESVHYYATRKKKSKLQRVSRFVGKNTRRIISTGIKTTKKVGKAGLRIVLKIIQKVVSILTKLLLGLEMIVIVIDFIVFLLIVAACWFWLNTYGIGGLK